MPSLMPSLLEMEAARLRSSAKTKTQARGGALPVIDPPSMPGDDLLALIRREAGSRPWIWIPVTPMGAVRQTQADAWRGRDRVGRYHAWRDRIRPYLQQITIPEDGAYWIFLLPMARSWSEKRRRESAWTGHQQRPDKNNLEKAVEDAALQEDCRLWRGGCEKRWWWHGGTVLIQPEPREHP